MDPNATITTETGALKIGKKVNINVKKDETINNLDRLYDTLVHHKHLLSVYQTACNEVVDPELYKLLHSCRERVQLQHGKIIDALFEMGEYTADAAPAAQVKDVSAVFMGYLNQLPYKNNLPH